MKRYLKLLSASVSAALAGTTSSFAGEPVKEPKRLDLGDNSFGNIPMQQGLNTSVPLTLAAHRSHSSHGSHGSHRSSSGSSARPTPNYSPPPPTNTQPTPKKQSEPLGQRAKPKETYDPAVPDARGLVSDKALRFKVIKKVQLRLTISGEYSGDIDGIMGPATRDAIDIFKIKNGLKRGGYLDLDTLNALGISVN
jgi:His-Xaa-Ser repeat protein HxsA